MNPRGIRAHFRVVLAAAALTGVVASCGQGGGQELSAAQGGTSTTPAEPATSSTLLGLQDGFRLVGEEAVGLNGRENENRPPIQFLLLAGEDDLDASEVELVDLYTSELRAAGWDVFPYDAPDDWWTVQGNMGGEFVRVGPASLFHERAKISEGYSRTVFRELAAENPGPLIVVSTDPAG